MEGVALDVVRRGTQVEGPTVEKHDRDVDTFVPGGNDALTQPVEVSLVERLEIELRLAIPCSPRPGARPWLRRHTEMETTPCGLRLELLPAPKPDEIVAVLLEEFQICVVVRLLWDIGAVRAGTHAVVEVVPDMRAS